MKYSDIIQILLIKECQLCFAAANTLLYYELRIEQTCSKSSSNNNLHADENEHMFFEKKNNDENK